MIYYVEDDTNIRDLALYALRQAGIEAQGFADARSFFAAVAQQVPDAALLDIMLPETDGLQILAQLRADSATAALPVMMITAKGTEYDTVTGLDAGADDYLAKPFGMMELVSRVNALLRRSNMTSSNLQEEDELVCGPVRLCAASHVVTADGQRIDLTLKEFELLHALLRNCGHVLTRDQLLDQVWSMTFAGGTRTVDVHVQTLRQKLAAAAPGADGIIHTVRGLGYAARRPEE